jgi:hypothetical protein
MTQKSGYAKNISVTPIPTLEYIRAWGVPVSVICSLSTMAVGVADFLSPKLKLLPPLTFLGMAAIVVVLLARLWLPGRNSSDAMGKWLNCNEPFFKAPAFNVAVVITLIFLVGTQVSTANAAKNGYLATNSSRVASLQQDFGLLESINLTTMRLEEKVDSAVSKLDDIKGVVTGVAPMSDPKMELARSGMSWSSTSFGDAIKHNDKRAVKLFLDGGMPAHQSERGAPAPPMANVMSLPEQERFAMLRLLAASSVPLGASWRAMVAGSSEDMCLATTCFGMDIRTCATSFPRVAMWRQLFELNVKLDTACVESLGDTLAELEASNSGESEHIQILRRWGVDKTQHYKQAISLQQASQSNGASIQVQGGAMKSIDLDNPRVFK